MVSKNSHTLFIKGKIIEQKHLENDYYEMTIEAPRIAEIARPGQFVMLSKWKIKELLLKRPFSFFQIDSRKGRFDILYKKVGKGTQILSESRVDEEVELIGPLGNGFYIPKNTHKIAIVARGIGIAPMMPLIQESRKKGIEIYSFLSAKEKALLLCDDKLESFSNNVFYTTDDGSRGVKGNVTCFLEELLEEKVTEIDAVFTCGSRRLARHIKELQKKHHFFAYISLEERMGCGIGSCKGCVVQTKYGYQRVCKEGPVFPLEEVALDE